MNWKNLLLATLFFATLSPKGQSQDIHFTMWDMAPLTVNPAFTGSFLGTARIGGIYRDQWRSFLNNSINSNPYVTPSFFVDAPLMKGFRKNDWIGVGGTFFTDKAGTLELSYSAFMGSAAYHLALNKEGTTLFTLGVQLGQKQRRINLDRARFADELPNRQGSSVDRAKTNEDPGASYFDVGGGAMFSSKLNETMDFRIGFSVGHPLKPEYNLFNNRSRLLSEQPLLTSLQGQFNIAMNDKITLSPAFFFQSMAGQNEIAIQSWGGYELNESFTLRAGLGYRLQDAAQIMLGMDNKDLRVALSYDLNVSSLTEATNSVGGFEIAAMYIIKIYKEPEVKPAILCPQL